MADDDWWYNFSTHTVEQDSDRSKAADRLGPYATRKEAEHAMERVAERNAQADREDEDDWGED